MRTALLLLASGLAIGMAMYFCRCRHEPIKESQRDERGRPTGVLRWRCFHCQQLLGVTELAPRRKLLTAMRRAWAEQRGLIRKVG